MVMLLNRKHWHEPTTEFPKLNSTEIWEFVNLTEDTHPMHMHLVRFQLLDRRSFDTEDYLKTNKIRYTGNPVPPERHRSWLEGHHTVSRLHRHPRHRPLRRLCRQIPLPLPHPRTRSQRHDAPLRSHRLTHET